MRDNRETLFASIAAVFMFSTVIVFGATRIYANLPPKSTVEADDTLARGDLKGSDREPITATPNQITSTSTPAPATATTLPPTFTATALPEPTETVTPIPTSTATPLPPTPTPQIVNGLPEPEFIILPEPVQTHVRLIFERGQQMGRDPRAFSRLGTSIVDTRFFLTRWDDGPYNLGDYQYLQPAIDYFEGSFRRIGVATQRGLSVRAVFNPFWADKSECRANETMIDCEIRLHNPAVLLIILGTNDIGPASEFEETLGELLQYTIDQGVIPVVATKADRYEGRDNRNNNIIRELAAEYRIPLWDYDLLSATISGRGLGSDQVHMTFFEQYDYTLAKGFQRGYGLFNLSALMMLESVRQAIVSGGEGRPDPADLIG